MNISEDISLKKYNTFGINVTAKYFSAFSTVEELDGLFGHSPSTTHHSPLIIGGGSNILFTKNFDGLVLKNEIKGIEKVKEDHQYEYIKAGAGEAWHYLVMYCVENNLGGIENLSLIPGNVGASPMQNIGAYGVEIKDVFHSLEAYHKKEKRIVTFNLNDCEFGYRESVFKRRFKDEFVILNVTYRLTKIPMFNISYGAIEKELEAMNVKELSIRSISQAVINIRSSKLPDPAIIGNAGSFFKNPTISNSQFQMLHSKFPTIIGYTQPGEKVKLAAGWLIEQCGWKGFRSGDTGCYDKQALVLVNYGNATGKQVFDLSEDILQSVKEKFDVELEREVNIV
ncbi:UDP-N-acetylmuramate dehydrogenase [Ferruginibacter albus]|uniref:UDP-N-acetylmuramate dehydrogenase n=1 Tax=Ferruginibacter albus TaxID=2875540 RepID=UPI001CC63B71|nr:UDP-N-acetylmuramate dehydrogenase [Ferruginibacter albus]UAY52950.1 UDP-N-acetylmuramate dehydrogenase [Ferruginibacter albus]